MQLENIGFSYNPFKAVVQLFRRSDWVYERVQSQPNGPMVSARWSSDGTWYNLSLMGVAVRFVRLLSDLKNDEQGALELRFDEFTEAPCFSHRNRTQDSVLKIIRAVFPTLQNKRGLKYSVEGSQQSTRTVFYWLCRDS